MYLVGQYGIKNHYEYQNGVKVKRYGRSQYGNGIINIIVANQPQQIGPPAIKKDECGHRCTGRITDKSQPLAAHIKLIEQSARQNTRRKNAEIGLNKYDDPGKSSEKPNLARGFR